MEQKILFMRMNLKYANWKNTIFMHVCSIKICNKVEVSQAEACNFTKEVTPLQVISVNAQNSSD